VPFLMRGRRILRTCAGSVITTMTVLGLKGQLTAVRSQSRVSRGAAPDWRTSRTAMPALPSWPGENAVTDRRRKALAAAGASLRRELRPGDVGELVRMHGELYATEHGYIMDFEAYVEKSPRGTRGLSNFANASGSSRRQEPCGVPSPS